QPEGHHRAGRHLVRPGLLARRPRPVQPGWAVEVVLRHPRQRPGGFLWSAQVAGDQGTSRPNCNTVNWINVSDWVIGRIGQTQWRSSALDGPVAPARPGNYWSGYCLTFANNAWTVAGGGMPNGYSTSTAYAAWTWFDSRGRASVQACGLSL